MKKLKRAEVENNNNKKPPGGDGDPIKPNLLQSNLPFLPISKHFFTS